MKNYLFIDFVNLTLLASESEVQIKGDFCCEIYFKWWLKKTKLIIVTLEKKYEENTRFIILLSQTYFLLFKLVLHIVPVPHVYKAVASTGHECVDITLFAVHNADIVNW